MHISNLEKKCLHKGHIHTSSGKSRRVKAEYEVLDVRNLRSEKGGMNMDEENMQIVDIMASLVVKMLFDEKLDTVKDEDQSYESST